MAKHMPPEVLEYLRAMGKAYGSQGGKTAAKNMTAAERKARTKKASRQIPLASHRTWPFLIMFIASYPAMVSLLHPQRSGTRLAGIHFLVNR